MPLKAVIDSLDFVDEALRPFYIQEGEKFHFDFEDDSVRDHRSVLPLRNAYDRTKADLTRTKAERDADRERLKTLPEDFDLEDWKKFKAGGDPKAQEQIVRIRQQLEAERDEWKNKHAEAEGQVRRVIVERSLEDALTTAGISSPTFVKAARALLIGQVKLEGDKPVVETDMGSFPVADYVKRWAASEGKDLVTPPSGGGARGNDRGTSTGGKSVSAKDLEPMTAKEKADFFAKNPGVVVTD